MDPRIYIYKITFVGQPYWYWGVHKEKKFDEYYMGSPVTNRSYWEMYEPIKEIVETFDYTDEGWSEALSREMDLIRPDLENPLCLNEKCGGVFSLASLRKAWEDPVRKLKMQEQVKAQLEKQWSDPGYRQSQSNKMKQQWSDPDFLDAAKLNRRGSGTMWITDGTKEGSKKIKKGDPIPEGFRPGRVCS
jgi:hypothetical protein